MNELENKPQYVNSFNTLNVEEFSEMKTKVAFESFIGKELEVRENLKILEIGCGAESHLNFGKNAYVVGIDIAAEQLDRNTNLQEKIVANIEDYQLPELEYDVIVAWWVLEHLSSPDLVLENCKKALKPNGFMILVSPDPYSLKGLITKFTPQWFHVFVSRYVWGNTQAGIDEQGPFRTYLKKTMSPQYINDFAENNKLSVELFQIYENYWQEALKKKYWFFNTAWTLAKTILEPLSLGNIHVDDTDYRFFIRKSL